ncbi:MAG: hypothetical protein JOY71_29890 [Acetobacteraceae bacterium]|nr:hypothetical protein [Acetobacteraceae bacterium]
MPILAERKRMKTFNAQTPDSVDAKRQKDGRLQIERARDRAAVPAQICD